VSAFEVGQRVRIANSKNVDAPSKQHIGACGTLSERVITEEPHWRIAFDDKALMYTWWWVERDLELETNDPLELIQMARAQLPGGICSDK
jgi:hypothetical protein